MGDLEVQHMDLEIELFKAGIKPSILGRTRELRQKGIIDTPGVGHYISSDERFLIASRNPLPLRRELTHEKIGILLGYFPKSCEEIQDTNKVDTFLNFGGIHFNTKGYGKEAFNWCKGRYLEDIIKLRGEVFYSFNGLKEGYYQIGYITRIKKDEI